MGGFVMDGQQHMGIRAPEAKQLSLSLALLANPAEDAEDSRAVKGFSLQGIISFNPVSSFCAARSSAYLEEDEPPADPSPVTHPITFPEQRPCRADIKSVPGQPSQGIKVSIEMVMKNQDCFFPKMLLSQSLTDGLLDWREDNRFLPAHGDYLDAHFPSSFPRKLRHEKKANGNENPAGMDGGAHAPPLQKVMTMNCGSNPEKPSGDIINQLSFAPWVYDDVIRTP
ncbi:hypothetical protein DUI87_15318 [Hirundo rustica rustica]|uniref:Uncharacterized protein n=1 Tax=Hirundo rustica rustica TaxID=333673 RepID=A0A3M0K3J0_HIRRU|nr:hypothetical protein DUI87_15318 [Hirundo rustica rustica]